MMCRRTLPITMFAPATPWHNELVGWDRICLECRSSTAERNKERGQRWRQKYPLRHLSLLTAYLRNSFCASDKNAYPLIPLS